MIREIPKQEYEKRIALLQKKMIDYDLDLIICFGHEAESQYLRYFADYKALFETGGIFIPREGEAILLIGPETEMLAKQWSKIDRIEKILEFRESAQPEYPGVALVTFVDLFEEVNKNIGLKRVGLVGSNIMYIDVYNAINKAAEKFNAELSREDKIVLDMRIKKDKIEIEAIREAYNICKISMENVLEKIKIGMTELEVTGIIEYEIRKNGAENEGYPIWCTSGKNTSAAIGRPSYKEITTNEIVLVSVGARVAGYSSSIVRPICFGEPDKNIKDLLKIGLNAEKYINSLLKVGEPAKEIAIKYKKFLKENGYDKFYLYGPCHSVGLMESEAPWIEEDSAFLLEEGMIFNLDIYLGNDKMGLRWEDGVLINKNGNENLSKISEDIIVL